MLKLAFVASLSVFFPLLFLFVVVAVWADLGKVLFEIGLKSTQPLLQILLLLFKLLFTLDCDC